MTKPIVRDPIYRRRRFDVEIIELCVRWYVTYRLRIELSGSRGDDGRARHCRIAHDDFSLGESLCAGIREAMEPLLTASEHVLARGRDGHSITVAMVDRGRPSMPPARREEAVAHAQWLCCRPYCDRAPHSHARECCGTL
jgi:hypothetical protein